jgi:hypothetical protein
MYVGVVSAVVGQALLLGDPRLFWFAIIVWISFHLFVLLYEEPTLRVTLGDEYEHFCANVPRWLPRIRPWRRRRSARSGRRNGQVQPARHARVAFADPFAARYTPPTLMTRRLGG